MGIRDRFHREVFVARVPEDATADARRTEAKYAPQGWVFHDWYWADQAERQTYSEDPEMQVLILWLRWSGEQQSQEPLRDDSTRILSLTPEKDPNGYGGWNQGTRAQSPVEAEVWRLRQRLAKQDAALAGMESGLASMSKGFAKLREWIANHPALKDHPLPEVVPGVTGEFAVVAEEVSPAPREWSAR